MAKSEPMSMGWKIVLTTISVAMILWVWTMWSDAGDSAAQNACEIRNQTDCVYDNRFEEWVPR